MVRPGDASVAAPFTSRVPSVRAVVDLIRQGRCTLLSALMHQQIMMLESIIAAYTLSALSLHNARSSERQMMASSWLIMTAAVAFSYSAPLDHMHPQRPIRSLFHPAIFVSMLGQAGQFSHSASLFCSALGLCPRPHSHHPHLQPTPTHTPQTRSHPHRVHDTGRAVGHRGHGARQAQGGDRVFQKGQGQGD
jgi:magnesium-transporting ATPase (P-type)